MSTSTTNLGLVKPAGTDPALIAQINGNMDKIDRAIGALPSESNLQGEIDSLNGKIAKYDYNKMSTVVDISSYNSSSNRYTIPNDGYLIIENDTSGNTGRMIVTSPSNNNGFGFGNSAGRFSVFVRKGMRAYCHGTADMFGFLELVT